MKVKEVIEQLQNQDQDAIVYYPLDSPDKYREVTNIGRLFDYKNPDHKGVILD